MRSDPGTLRRWIYGWLGQSSPRLPLRKLFLALCCFLVLIRRSLSDFCLSLLAGQLGIFMESRGVQILDAFGLFGRRLTGDSSLARLDEGFIEPLIAAVGIVVLLATVVGLDDDGTGPRSDIARRPYLMMKSAGYVVQKGTEGHLQRSFRIHS
jgi:hypothetical protein